jgi:hypothetical protein
MTSIEERLRAADPMAGQEYHPADLDAMIARIVTPARRVRPVRDPVWATFKTRVAVALAGTATAMTLGITLLAGLGNSLPALSFATVSSLGANAPVSMALMPTTNYVFSASSDLPTASGTAPTYVLSPVGPRTALARVATALSLDLGTLQTYDFGQSYSASGPLYSAWSQQNQGYSSWGLAANTLTTYGYGTQSASEAVTAARSFASTLTDLPLGTPTLTQIPAGVTPPLTPGVALSTFDAGLTLEF